jgi:bacterioferritin-associated ferredoxin
MRWMITLLLALTLSTASISAVPAHAHSVRQVKKTVVRVAKQCGLCEADQRALLKIAKRESHFNEHDLSPSGKYKGVFQLGFKHGMKRWRDPAWNTKRAIKYIKHRYGTPRVALNHCYRYGWY